MINYKLSIITPVFNNLKFTKVFISEVQKNTKSDYQLIIINNNSTDGTSEYLRTFSSLSNIKIIENNNNYGFGYANNQGIEMANSKYICFINNDVLLYPGWDADLIRPFNSIDNIGATGPVTNNCAGVQCDEYGLNNISKEEYRLSAEKRSKNKTDSYREYHRVIGFCLLAETQLIKSINGFDEMFNIGNYEDDDLCMRILLTNNKIIICENVFVYHFGSVTFKANNINYLNSISNNAKLFSQKWNLKLWPNGHYSYEIDKLNKGNIVNQNYLTNKYRKQNSNEYIPECATLGNLTKFKQLTLTGTQLEVEDEYNKLLDIRPFHPEALLQLIDYYLENKQLSNASACSHKLLNMTPSWPLANKLAESFGKSLIVNNNRNILNEIISFCLITKNEEENISRCLNSIKAIQNKQIIVVDTGSTDDTIKIAKSYGAEIYHYDWDDDFSKARNQFLRYASGDWILFLDADEELDDNAEISLKEDMAKSNILGYRLALENVGSPLNGCNYVPRFFRNAPGLYFIGKIHEQIFATLVVLANQWHMENSIGKTKILHHGYSPDEIQRKGKLKRNLALYEDALAELPDEPSIMMNYAHDLNHDGQKDRAYEIYKKIHTILEQYKAEDITPEVREQFIHNYGVFLAQEKKMEGLVEVMMSRTARDTGPVANVHYMAGLGLINCKRYEDAIKELMLCEEKSFDDSLAPSVPEVRTWKPRHLLANAHASIDQENEALCFWDEVIGECSDSADPFHDYARYLSTLNRNKRAMEVLVKGLDAGLNDQKIWELGACIVNSDPELAGMAMDWTEEAVQYFPESDVTNVRRGEALMKNGRYLEAIPFFERLTSRGERNATAAHLICKKMMDQLSTEDLEKVPLVQNELKGWTEIMDKAPGEFDRELAEQLIH